MFKHIIENWRIATNYFIFSLENQTSIITLSYIVSIKFHALTKKGLTFIAIMFGYIETPNTYIGIQYLERKGEDIILC